MAWVVSVCLFLFVGALSSVESVSVYIFGIFTSAMFFRNTIKTGLVAFMMHSRLEH